MPHCEYTSAQTQKPLTTELSGLLQPFIFPQGHVDYSTFPVFLGTHMDCLNTLFGGHMDWVTPWLLLAHCLTVRYN